LVVEDDPVHQELTQHALTAFDGEETFVPTVVATLGDALRAVKERPFDAIILDLELPDSKGLATVQTLVPEAGGVPVIIATSHAESNLGKEAIKFGAQDYLVKGQGMVLLIGSSILHAIERSSIMNKLRESESRLAFLVSTSPVAIYMRAVTAPYGISYMSQNIQALMGLEPRQFTEDEGFWVNNIHPEDRQAVFGAMPDVARLGAQKIEYRFRLGDGSYRWMHDELRVVSDGTSKPDMIIGYWMDIHDRIQMEDRIKLSNAELQHFAYVASHDLQEPIRTIISFLQLLKQRKAPTLDFEAQEFIGFAVDGAKRMSQLIQDLLQYSRISTQGNKLEPISSEQCLQTALRDLAASIEQSQAKVDVHGEWPIVLADQGQLVRLFGNLIGNALKYHHPERTPKIDILVERMDGVFQFAVRDNGIGIEAKFFDRIFVVFQRLHGLGQYEGTGIGLSICKKIVERHGGRIWVCSDGDGKGSTFYFTIPS